MYCNIISKNERGERKNEKCKRKLWNNIDSISNYDNYFADISWSDNCGNKWRQPEL